MKHKIIQILQKLLSSLSLIIILAFLFFSTNCKKSEEGLAPDEDPETEDTDYITFKSIDGDVVLSAENYSYKAGSKGSWSMKSEQEGYIGTGYMLSSEDNPQLTFDTTLTNLNYEINFDQIGTYYVHLRTFAADHSTNGFFASIDWEEINYGGANPEDASKTATYIYVEKVNRWLWYTDGGGAETRNLKVSFELKKSGKHTFTIYRRDTGSMLDHIWITKKESNPQKVQDLTLGDVANYIVEKNK